MAAEYDFQRKPNPKGDGELQPMYPRIVNKGTITGKRLVSDISQATSFTPGDVEGVLAALESRISYYLSEGHHVQLGNMGHFSAGLTARHGQEGNPCADDIFRQGAFPRIARLPETVCRICGTCKGRVWLPAQ